ncbi:MAG: quinone oxidoreductase, partial [Phycisphaeraceae bacterium]
MRAWVIEEHGGPEVFKEVELPTPEPGPGEVRIKVAATSVNPVDYKIRSGAA